MSGQHSRATEYRSFIRQVVSALEKANIAATQLPYGWDAEIPAVQRGIRAVLTEAQRMARNANAMVAAENAQLEQEKNA